MGFLGDIGKYVSPALTAATTVASGYEDAKANAGREQIASLIQSHQLRERERQQRLREAIGARSAGYVPTSEKGPNERSVLDGGSVDKLMDVATDGMPGAGAMSVAHPDVKAPRYGVDVSGFSYDSASAPAQKEAAQVGDIRAQIAQRTAQAKRAQLMLPSADMRQKLIDAGNSEEDVDAALATGDPASIRTLLRPPQRDPIADFETKHDYSVAHPLPSRSTDGETADHRVARQNATAVRQQLNATRSDLATAQRAVPKQPAFYASPADSTDFVHRRGAAQDNVSRLRQRADSLTGVLDKQTANMQAGAPAVAQAHADDGTNAALTAELENNQRRYQALVQAGADANDAKAALLMTNQQTRQKYAPRAP